MSSNQLTAIAFENRPKNDWLPLVSLKELHLRNNRIVEIANLDLLAELETLDLS
jgi:Leucine-rich repeat (LRR) protein